MSHVTLLHLYGDGDEYVAASAWLDLSELLTEFDHKYEGDFIPFTVKPVLNSSRTQFRTIGVLNTPDLDDATFSQILIAKNYGKYGLVYRTRHDLSNDQTEVDLWTAREGFQKPRIQYLAEVDETANLPSMPVYEVWEQVIPLSFTEDIRAALEQENVLLSEELLLTSYNPENIDQLITLKQQSTVRDFTAHTDGTLSVHTQKDDLPSSQEFNYYKENNLVTESSVLHTRFQSYPPIILTWHQHPETPGVFTLRRESIFDHTDMNEIKSGASFGKQEVPLTKPVPVQTKTPKLSLPGKLSRQEGQREAPIKRPLPQPISDEKPKRRNWFGRKK